ncbi:MAG: flagellar hook-basal body complex protein [Planctomycetes bacterium]|nr:flagellar hook-basal body complex protein [Planctomycetota bacterium]
MNDALFIAASGMNAVQELLDNSARNTVNSQSPGFMSHRLVIKNFGSYLDTASERQGLIGTEERIQFEQGDLRHNDSPYALALQGDAFFSVRAEGEGEFLTRNGDFHAVVDGRLLTRGGYELLGQDGEPIVVNPLGGPVRIDEDGTVLQDDAEIARIKLTEFDLADRNRLVPAAETLYSFPEGATGRPPTTTTVHQGYLEFPAFGMRGMIEMLMSTKAYDSTQRAIRAMDQLNEQAIRSVQ